MGQPVAAYSGTVRENPRGRSNGPGLGRLDGVGVDKDTDAYGTDEDRHLTTPSGLAYLALLQHTQTCEQCTDDPANCGTGRALIKTAREARYAESAAKREVHG